MNHEKRKTNSRDTESEEQHGETVPSSPAFLMNEGIWSNPHGPLKSIRNSKSPTLGPIYLW